MAEDRYSDSSDSEPKPGPSGVKIEPKTECKSEDSSTSESEIGAYSENFKPLKALYSERIMLPVLDAPLFENLQQYESSLKTNTSILAVGQRKEALEREEKKLEQKLATQKALEEKNRLRFAKYEAPVKRERRAPKNVLTRQEKIGGPLGALRDCMAKRLKVKVITRGHSGLRGFLYGYVEAFDKHWNLVLTEVLEVYQRKATRKLKIPPAGGRPVPKGTADMISPLPSVIETPLGNGKWECVRHLPQIMVRGEHVVLVNIIDQ
ncbi:U6 snRNA-associated Sm-like protein LSm11 [Choristoneura fumiferana]|uniref:U6 snRNA-associated Sm-like protein LSm11 n=1 Tax=Choristoneura fumiferana TaxID=7141 RepID=UPI003D15B522